MNWLKKVLLFEKNNVNKYEIGIVSKLINLLNYSSWQTLNYFIKSYEWLTYVILS